MPFARLLPLPSTTLPLPPQALKTGIVGQCGLQGPMTSRVIFNGKLMMEDQYLEAYRLRPASALHFVVVQPVGIGSALAVDCAASGPEEPAAEVLDQQDSQDPETPSSRSQDPYESQRDAAEDEWLEAHLTLAVSVSLPDHRLVEFTVPMDATVLVGKEVVESRCAAPKELQRWSIGDTHVGDWYSLADSGPTGRQVRVCCEILPKFLQMVVKVIFFTPPVRTESGPELSTRVPLLESVLNLKLQLAAELELEVDRIQLLFDQLQLQDARTFGAYGLDAGEVLSCVVYPSAADG